MSRNKKRAQFLHRTKLVGEKGARAFIEDVLIDDLGWYFRSVNQCAFFSQAIRISAFIASIATTVLASLMRSNSTDSGATLIHATLLVVFGVITSISAILLAPSNQLWQLRSEGKRTTRAVYEEALVRIRKCTTDDHWDDLHTWMRKKEQEITDHQANAFFTILSTSFKPSPPAPTNQSGDKDDSAEHHTGAPNDHEKEGPKAN